MLAQKIWLELKPETRKKLAVYLEIPRSGHTEVVNDMMGNGVVVSDGYTYDDLSTVTLEKLQGLFNEPEEKDFYKLFNKLVTNFEKPPVEISESQEPTHVLSPVELPTVEKQGRPKKIN